MRLPAASNSATFPGPVSLRRSRLPTSIANSGRWPRSSAVARISRPSGANRNAAIERSQSPRGEADRAARRVAHDEAEAVGLEAGPLHRQVREQAAVRRERGLRVPGGIVRRQVDGRAAAVGRHAPDVEVGRDRLELPAQPRREHELRSVRAERIVRAAAVRLRRDVGVERGRERHRLAARPPLAVERDRKELGDAAVLPGVPVAHEQPVVSLPARLRRALLVEPLAGALEVAAVREDLERDDQPAAPRRRPESCDVERQPRDLRRLAAADRQEPHLRRAAARGEEEDAAAVGGPVGGAVVFLVAREPARGCVAVEVEHPQVVAAAVGREVGLAQRVDERRPSGEIAGSEMRAKPTRSCAVKPCGAAPASTGSAAIAAAARSLRITWSSAGSGQIRSSSRARTSRPERARSRRR